MYSVQYVQYTVYAVRQEGRIYSVQCTVYRQAEYSKEYAAGNVSVVCLVICAVCR